MGITATLASAGISLDWIYDFNSDKMRRLLPEVRKIFNAVQKPDCRIVEIRTESTDMIVATALYFIKSGWDVRIVYPDADALETTLKRCLYIFIDIDNTDMTELSKELSSKVLKGNRALFVRWGER